MMLTSVNVVSPSTSRNVVRIDTAAMSSGSSARNEANTKSSTSKRTRPRRAASRPARSVPPGLAARGEQGVRRQAAVEARRRRRLLQRGVELGLDVGPKVVRDRRLDQGVRRCARRR